MTQPPEQRVAPFDFNNPLLGETPAQLTSTVIPTANGQRLAVTIRTGSTTITVFLSREDATAWADNIATGAKKVSGLIAAPPGMRIGIRKPE